ncbi:MAG: SDR family oxidoreductase [bacterium]
MTKESSNINGKKILITGGLGYIGSVLSSYLKAAGFSCTVYDTGFFKDCLFYPASDPQVIMNDMRRFTEEQLNGIYAVIHLAAISNDPFGNLNSEQIYGPTRAYAKHIALLCKKRKIKFIFASSCSVYGKGADGLMDEESQVDPQTAYSLNKLQIENDLKEISGNGFQPIMLRLATVFGISPRMRFDIVLNMLTGMAFTTGKLIINSDGKAWRPLVHLKDVCKAFTCAVVHTADRDAPLVLNVGDTSHNYQIIHMISLIKKIHPACEVMFLNNNKKIDQSTLEIVKDRKIQDGVDTRTYKVSFEKIKQVFKDFRCDWSIEAGIKDLFNQYRRIKLSEQQFKSINFYRLQKIEYLHVHKLLNDDLYWTGKTREVY